MPPPFVFEPWLLSKDEQKRFGVNISMSEEPNSYPQPVDVSDRVYDRPYEYEKTASATQGGPGWPRPGLATVSKSDVRKDDSGGRPRGDGPGRSGKSKKSRVQHL